MNENIIRVLMEECEMDEKEISHITKKEALKNILEYEGIIGYTEWIIGLIEDIYEIKLEN